MMKPLLSKIGVEVPFQIRCEGDEGDKPIHEQSAGHRSAVGGPSPQIRVDWLLLMLLLLALISTAACGGQAPEASKARSRAVINAGAIVPAEEVRVAEYLQYYEQHFPEPSQDAVGLDLRLGNSRMPAQGGPVWLQMGLQARSAETDIVAPLNLALVIDRSGSMSDQGKMDYVKQSLRIFLESLKPEDRVAIVTYSDEAELLLPAQPVGEGRWVQGVIDRIQPGGSTNLHAGMLLGLQEVDRTFDVRRNNRVILLTDGIANVGGTDPNQIAADALTYNQRGIYLSTIGLGLEFNDALLSQLADQGQGGYSFIDSAQEMERVFREHVAGLKQRVASEVSLTVIPEAGVQLAGLTGLEGVLPAEGASVPLWPLGSGDSAVILAHLQVQPMAGPAGVRPLARVQLNYFDEFARRPVVVEQVITVEIAPNLSGYDPTWDLEILRNVTIQQTAEGMREIDRLFQAGQYEEAWRLAGQLEAQLTNVAQLTGDSQMGEDVKLMQRYQQTLAEAVWQTQNRAPQLADRPLATPAEPRPYRGEAGGQPVPTPSLPTVEVR
jgi:Ca-activated chloride channel family protein